MYAWAETVRRGAEKEIGMPHCGAFMQFLFLGNVAGERFHTKHSEIVVLVCDYISNVY